MSAAIDDKIDELRAATRTANEALADIKAERKLLERDVNEFRQYMQTSLHQRIEEAVGREFVQLGEDLAAGRDRTVAKIDKAMENYWRLMIGAEGNDEEEVGDLLKAKLDEWERRLQVLEGRRRA